MAKFVRLRRSQVRVDWNIVVVLVLVVVGARRAEGCGDGWRRRAVGSTDWLGQLDEKEILQGHERVEKAVCRRCKCVERGYAGIAVRLRRDVERNAEVITRFG